MNRFYCAFSSVRQDKIIISDPVQLHHLKDVLRFKPGEKAVIFDDQGAEYSAVLSDIFPDRAEFLIRDKKTPAPSGKPRITIACALPKKSKIDDIIDRLTQLGVDRVIPLITERVIVKMDKERSGAKQQRWAGIALSASKQSQRNTVPAVDPVTDFSDLIEHCSEFDLKLIPNLLGERKGLKEVLSGKEPENVLVLIGPEGDFTPEEVDAAVKAGFIPVTFGNLVFRVETACLYIASVLNYELR